MAEKIKKGLFIVFDGPEGSGKSTHSRRLYRDLLSSGFDVVLTAEPGGTAMGKLIRDVLLVKREMSLDKSSELFLFEADRAQHVSQVIRPALERGKVVLCDRYNLSTFAYQGAGLGMNASFMKRMDKLATGGLEPDLVLVFDIDPREGLMRAKGAREADKMEKRGLEFHRKVREAYLAFARNNPGRIKVISSRLGINEVYEKAKKEVYGFLERHKGRGALA